VWSSAATAGVAIAADWVRTTYPATFSVSSRGIDVTRVRCAADTDWLCRPARSRARAGHVADKDHQASRRCCPSPHFAAPIPGALPFEERPSRSCH